MWDIAKAVLGGRVIASISEKKFENPSFKFSSQEAGKKSANSAQRKLKKKRCRLKSMK